MRFSHHNLREERGSIQIFKASYHHDFQGGSGPLPPFGSAQSHMYKSLRCWRAHTVCKKEAIIQDDSFRLQGTCIYKRGFVLQGKDTQSTYYKIHSGSAVAQQKSADSRPRGCGFESHQRHCVVSLNKTK